MKEIINIHCGQAGCQIGNALWELYCLEHGVLPDGSLCPRDCAWEHSIGSNFLESSAGKLTPRAIYVDLEPLVINEIRTGTYRTLFDPECLLSGNDDGASNFARGYYGIGRTMLESVLEQFRRQIEACNEPQGYILYHSYAGGTGSGLGASIMENIAAEYSKLAKVGFGIFPSNRLSAVITEPYNTVFNANQLGDTVDIVFIVDNEALWDIVSHKLDVSRPTFTNINRLCAQALSNITAGSRFSGNPNIELHDFHTNLVPFRENHYSLISYAPITTANKAMHKEMETSEITHEVFNQTNCMLKVKVTSGQYIAIILFYRGPADSTGANMAINKIRERQQLDWVSWRVQGFKIGFNNSVPVTVPGGDMVLKNNSVVLLANSTAIKEAWKRVAQRYEQLYSRKAFVHWYTSEGMEADNFDSGRDYLRNIIQSYDFTTDSKDDDDFDS